MEKDNAPLSKTIKITEADFVRLGDRAEPFESPGRTLTRILDKIDEIEEGHD